MDRIHAECSAREHVSCDDDTSICAGLIDPSNPKWREEVRSELLDDDLEVQFVSGDNSGNGYQDLAQAVGKANDVISSLQVRAQKRQSALTDYFK